MRLTNQTPKPIKRTRPPTSEATGGSAWIGMCQPPTTRMAAARTIIEALIDFIFFSQNGKVSGGCRPFDYTVAR